MGMTANRTGASVTIGLLNNTKRVALYLPVDTNGAEFTVKFDGKQIYQGTTIGPDRIWENRVVLPVVGEEGSKLEVVVGEGAPGSWRFDISGATFFSEHGPTPAPSPTPTPPPAPTPPTPPTPPPAPSTSCGSDQQDVENSGSNMKGLANPELDTTVCCKACDELEACAGWTLNIAQRKCWLKSSIVPHARSGVISGAKKPVRSITVANDTLLL